MPGGYTNNMKVSLSIPDDVFDAAERFSRQTNMSRSRLYIHALKEYLIRHSPDEITDAVNRVCEELGDTTQDPFVSAAARRILENTER